MFTLYFQPATQGSVGYNMGEYETREAAEAAQPAALAEIMDQIGSGSEFDEMRDETRRGTFSIVAA